jgi:hypothetical protein
MQNRKAFPGEIAMILHKPASRALLLLTPLMLAFAVIANSAQAQNLVGYWKFDDGSGTTAVDSSGYGHTATLFNGVTWVTGKMGDAVAALAPRRQYVGIPQINLSTTKAATVSLWANRTYSTGGGHVLFEATINYNNSTTGFGFFPDDATCQGIQAALKGNIGYVANCYGQPSSGVWHHIAVVFDKTQTGGNQVKLYIDGALQPVNWNIFANTNTNYFGNNPIFVFSRGGTQEFNSGKVDDLRIYNTALTAAQILAIYQGDPTLVSIAVTPVNPSITVGGQQQFTATGTYSDGSHQDLTTTATWTSSTPGVATVNSTGLATGVGAGNTTITASSGSIQGSTGLTVTGSPVLVSIAVTPVNPSITVGGQQQFTATGTYSDGSHQDLTSTATWTSSTPTVATINSTGLATGVSAGSTTIQAAVGTINGSTGLTVTQPVQHYVSLAWTASTSPVVGYNAYRSTTSGGPYTKLNSSLISGTAYSDQTVQQGATYYYVTTAVNSQGVESVYSNQAVATVP